MPFTWIPLQCPHFAVKSSPQPSGFGCIVYCLARENGEWVVKTPQPHSWMKMTALRANLDVRTLKLSNFDRRKSKHLNGFLCFHFRLGYKCHNNLLLNKALAQSVKRKHKPSVKQPVDQNRSNRFLTSAVLSHIFTRFGRYLHSKMPSRIIIVNYYPFLYTVYIP